MLNNIKLAPKKINRVALNLWEKKLCILEKLLSGYISYFLSGKMI